MIVLALTLGTFSFCQESCYIIKNKISIYDSEIKLYDDQVKTYSRKMDEHARYKDSNRTAALNYAQYKNMRDNALKSKEKAQAKKSDAQSKLRICKE